MALDRRAWLAMIAAAVCGCERISTLTLSVPPIDGSVHSMLLFALSDSAVTGQAIELSNAEVELRFEAPRDFNPRSDQVLALAYPHPLELLNLAQGGIEFAALADPENRAIPPPLSAFIGDGKSADWQRAASVPVGFLARRIKLRSPDQSSIRIPFVAVGANFSCAAEAAGEVFCWGSSPNILSTAGSTRSAVALRIPGLRATAKLSAGDHHVCALDRAGQVSCFGEADLGQLGRGDTSPGATPEPVHGIDEAVDVVSGNSFSCVLHASGLVACWGDNSNGQTGAQMSAGGVQVAGLPNLVALPLPALDISAGGDNVCARLSDQTVWCWGQSRQGELGTTDSPYSATPVRQVAISEAIAIASGRTHECVQLPSGEFRRWGSVWPDPVGSLTPTVLSRLGPGKLLASGSASCSLSSSGSLSCMGRSSVYVRLAEDPLRDTTRLAGLGAISDVGCNASGGQCCASGAGGVGCWGWNGNLQLGQEATTYSAQPKEVLEVGETAFGVGNINATCLLDRTGREQCFGLNNNNILLAGESQVISKPLALPGLPPAIRMSLGNHNGCVQTSTADPILCWGANTRGQIGDGTTSSTRAPTRIPGTVGALEMTSSGDETCVVLNGGQLWCWGENASGQLGDGTLSDRNVPTRVLMVGTVEQVSISWGHACAVSSAHEVWCWGRNDDQQVGYGHPQLNATPVLVGISNAVEVSVGNRHSCARLDSGAISCWGANSFGQLGDGSRVARGVPGLVDRIDNATQLVARADGACALLASGEVHCWGLGDLGQNGMLEETGGQPTPAPVIGLPEVASLFSGDSHTCGLTATRRVYCWGSNAFGQLGLGVALTATVPQLVRGL